MRKFFFLLILTTLIFLSAAATTILFKVDIPVGGLVRAFAAIASIATDREISIEGTYYVIPGRWLHLRCENGKIYVNDQQHLQVTATISKAGTQINLPQLLRKKILLDHVTVRGMSLDLKPGLHQAANNLSVQEDKLKIIGNYAGLLKQIGGVDVRNVDLSITTDPGNTPLDFKVDSISGFFGESHSGQLKIAGNIHSNSVDANLKFDPLGNITRHGTVFNYSANIRYAEADFYMEGRISDNDRGYKLDSDFSVKNFKFAKISSAPDNRLHPGAPISCAGQLSVLPGELKIHVNRFLPGIENLSALVTFTNTSLGSPVLISDITADLIDIDRVMSVFRREKELSTTQGANPEGKKIRNDIVIFPEKLSEKSLELNLKVRKINVAGREMTGFATHILMDKGVIKDAPFSASLKTLSLQGTYSLDVSSEPPRLQVQYRTTAWDLGATLRNAGLTEDVDWTVATTLCSYAASGRRLSDLFNDLEFTIQGYGGLLRLEDRNIGAELPVEIESFTITGKPGAETALQLEGQIAGNQIGVSAAVEDKRGVPLNQLGRIPFWMTVACEDSALKLTGVLPVPFNLVGTSMNFSLSGRDVNSLSDIIKVELPLTGAYRFAGNFHVVPEGYRVNNLEISLGDSLVTVDASLDTTVQIPKLSMGLLADRVQLGDLKKSDVHARVTAGTGKVTSSKESKERANIAASLVPRYVDASVDLEIKKLLSGNDYIGNGSIHCELNDGKITFRPVHIYFPEGEVEAEFSMEQVGDDRLYALKVDTSKLDYGIFSRWYEPDTDQRGILNLRSSLTTQVHGDDNFLSRATGYIDFCFQPENLRAGIVDLWAINLVSYLSPILLPTSESKLNCIAGRFNLSDGKMKNEALLADTSKIQVKGTMEVDFSRRWIDSRLSPIPKRPQFYSLATPLQISGRLDNLKAGVARGGLIGTMIRILTSYVVVPIQWLVNEKVPVDGTDHCLDIYNQREHRADDELRK